MSDKIKPWKLLESKSAIDSKWFPVRQDKCELPNGNVLDDYFVVNENNWVNVLAVTTDDEVILVKQYRHGIQKVVLEIVAGIIDSEDGVELEAARVAAMRELEEETSYQVDEDKLIYLGYRHPNSARNSNKVYMFLATDLEKQTEQKLDMTEDIEVVKVPLTEFVDMAFSEQLPTASQMPVIVLGLKHLGVLKL